ncbi:hypothetical protein C5D18_02575 [Rathayibacter tritici]|nr:hypothetical protein C5D18_02575 [Rathayibacter tritici]
MGKTVLAQREAPNAFTIQGHAIQKVDDFWMRFAGYLGIPSEKSQSKVTGDRSKWNLLSRLGIFGIGEAGAEIGGEHTLDVGASSNTIINAEQAAHEAVEIVIAKGGRVTVVVDDFHFIPREVRVALVQALKPLAYVGATVILITLPHRRAETTDLVSDMTGRTALVEVTPWAQTDLAEIASLGFPELNLTDLFGLGDRLAAASYGSPQIMQQLCLELVETVNEVLERSDTPKALVAPSDWAEFHREVRDEGAIKWVQRFIGGPSVRGQKRKKHQLLDGRTFDGYQVIIAALKELGPPLDLSLVELNVKIDAMLKSSKSGDVTVGGKLAQMSELASKPLKAKLKEAEDENATAADIFEAGSDDDPAGGTPQPVFEYMPDDVGKTIHILEPYVAYTIRWHVDALLA